MVNGCEAALLGARCILYIGVLGVVGGLGWMFSSWP